MDSSPDADVLGDLVARERRTDDVASSHPSPDSGRRRSGDAALVAPRENRRYDYRRFCATARKTGNFWRRRGVHADATVAVAARREPEAIFSFLGAALLGARTRFGLPGARGRPGVRSAERAPGRDARVVVAPHDGIGAYEVPAGTQRVAYGGPPDDPAVAHFERDVWSENPAFPETPVDPESVALAAGRRERDGFGDDAEDRTFSHADLLTGAREVVDDWDLEPGDEVAVRTSLARPGAVVAGVVAPLLAGAAVLLPDSDAEGTAAVVADDGDAVESVPESQTVAASNVL